MRVFLLMIVASAATELSFTCYPLARSPTPKCTSSLPPRLPPPSGVIAPFQKVVPQLIAVHTRSNANGAEAAATSDRTPPPRLLPAGNDSHRISTEVGTGTIKADVVSAE